MSLDDSDESTEDENIFNDNNIRRGRKRGNNVETIVLRRSKRHKSNNNNSNNNNNNDNVIDIQDDEHGNLDDDFSFLKDDMKRFERELKSNNNEDRNNMSGMMMMDDDEDEMDGNNDEFKTNQCNYTNLVGTIDSNDNNRIKLMDKLENFKNNIIDIAKDISEKSEIDLNNNDNNNAPIINKAKYNEYSKILKNGFNKIMDIKKNNLTIKYENECLKDYIMNINNGDLCIENNNNKMYDWESKFNEIKATIADYDDDHDYYRKINEMNEILSGEINDALTKDDIEDSNDEKDDDIVIEKDKHVSKAQVTCDLTQKLFVKPVESKLCGHVYEKDVIIDIINKHVGNTPCQCPIPGCNKTISIKDLKRSIKTEKLLLKYKRYSQQNNDNSDDDDGGMDLTLADNGNSMNNNDSDLDMN